MDELRKEFESIEQIEQAIKSFDLSYSWHNDSYYGDGYGVGFVNGAWFMFQELKKKQQ